MPNPLLDPLFERFVGGGLSLPNRFVMAPMSRYFSPAGVPGQDVAAYYGRRVAGGVGLVITEGAWIDNIAAANDDRCPRLYGEDARAGWKLTVAAVHEAGGKIVPQLWHVGAQRKTTDRPNPGIAPQSPSGLQGPGLQVGEPMTIKVIEATIDAFARAAVTAKDLGFDGIELHAAHGYLIDQFFWEGSNQRTDAYGGGLLERTRFGAEIVVEIRRRVGPDFPIIMRFSQWKLPDYDARLFQRPSDLAIFLDRFCDAGVDIFHCSVRRYWDPAFDSRGRTLAGWTRQLSGRPTITVGSVGLSEAMGPSVLPASPASLDRVAALYAQGEFDLLAIGRMLIAVPDFVNRLRQESLAELPIFTPAMIRTHFGSGGPERLY